ncbi:MAG: rod-binding protein [Verrucomicrobiota bacterium]
MSLEVHSRIGANQVPLEKLAHSTCPPGEKLAEVSRQFEAVLLRQIFSEAQKPVFQSKFNTSSVAGDIYKDLITNQLADQVSRSGSFGLARSLEQQLQHQIKTGEEPKASQPAPAGPTALGHAQTHKRYD